MPGRDGTGPGGMGPMTGRAAGPCANNTMPGRGPGRGLGLGRGRGAGLGQGLGRGAGLGMGCRGGRRWNAAQGMPYSEGASGQESDVPK